MNRFLATYLPLPCLVICIGLLQWHSMQFWFGAIGITGYPWSVALELVNLWLWLKPVKTWFRPLAWLSTLLLLAGPVYEVSNPVVEEILSRRDSQTAKAQESELVRSAISEKQRELNFFLDIARARIGWQGKIDQAQSDLERLRSKLEAITSSTATANTHSVLDWQRRGLIVLQLLSILVFQAAVVLVLGHFSELLADKQRDLAIHAHANNSNGCKNVEEKKALIAALQTRIQAEINNGKSRQRIAKERGFAPKYVTYILNYEKYPKAPGFSLRRLRHLSDCFQSSQ